MQKPHITRNGRYVWKATLDDTIGLGKTPSGAYDQLQWTRNALSTQIAAARKYLSELSDHRKPTLWERAKGVFKK